MLFFHIVKFFYLKLKFSVEKSNYGFFHFSTKTKDGIRWDDRKYHATLMIENSSISSTPSYYLWQKQLCRIRISVLLFLVANFSFFDFCEKLRILSHFLRKTKKILGKFYLIKFSKLSIPQLFFLKFWP